MRNFGRLGWRVVLGGWLVALLVACGVGVAGAEEAVIYRVRLKDTIQPVSAGRLERAMERAGRERAAAVLVVLDTPGGLLESTREMVGAMLASPVPVIVYVAPGGARAGSAGFFLLEAADIAAMAPASNAGAAHPVLMSGTPDATMKEKMENDAAAFLRSYAGARGRNVEAAETAVRSSKSFSAEEAKGLKLIDLVAFDESSILKAMDGKPFTRGGAGAVFHFKNARVEEVEPTVREQILGWLTNPNLALLLLFGGGLLIYMETNMPGTIVPGAVGTVMVLLAVFSLNLLPVRGTAILLLVAAAVMVLLELKFASHGVLGVAGVACLALGMLTLIDAPIDEMRIRPAVALGLSVGFGVITLALLRLAIRAKRQKSLVGVAALVGSSGMAMEPLMAMPAGMGGTVPGLDAVGTGKGLVGHVMVQGEIWQAVTGGPGEAPGEVPISVGTAVRVTGFSGDILQVRAE